MFDVVETAFFQLMVAIKLKSMAENDLLKAEKFDFTVINKDKHGELPIGPSFRSQEELRVVLVNNVIVNYGAAAVIMDEARRRAGIRVPDKKAFTATEECATIIFQIRNCFAHNMAEPVWSVERKGHLRSFSIGNLTVDLRSLNGKRFDFSDVGGISSLFVLRHSAYALGVLPRP